MIYKILGSFWYTPTFPGADPLQHNIYDLPNIVIGFVAIESRPGAWKCYMGWVPTSGNTPEQDEQRIASNGTKVSKEVACAYFPLPPEEFES